MFAIKPLLRNNKNLCVLCGKIFTGFFHSKKTGLWVQAG